MNGITSEQQASLDNFVKNFKTLFLKIHSINNPKEYHFCRRPRGAASISEVSQIRIPRSFNCCSPYVYFPLKTWSKLDFFHFFRQYLQLCWTFTILFCDIWIHGAMFYHLDEHVRKPWLPSLFSPLLNIPFTSNLFEIEIFLLTNISCCDRVSRYYFVAYRYMVQWSIT